MPSLPQPARPESSQEHRWVFKRTPGVSWQVRPDYQWLFEGRGSQAVAGIQVAHCHTVKSRPMRAVRRLECRGPQGRQFFYLKSYRPVTAVDKLRRRWFGSPARREAAKADQLRQRGLPVPEVAAVGVSTRQDDAAGVDYLLTVEIPDACPLGRVFQQWRGDRQTWQPDEQAFAFVHKLAEFVLRLHDAGIYQRDFHADNVLVQNSALDPAFYLVDVQKVKVFDYPLPVGRRLSNLAEVGKWFFEVVPESWHLAFLTRYVRGSEELAGRLSYVCGWVKYEILRRCWRLWRRRGRRCVRENRYFAMLTGTGRRGYVVRDWLSGELADLLAEPEGLLQGANIIKDGATNTTGWRQVRNDGQSRPVFIKRFNRKRKNQMLRAVIRGSRALRAWKAANALALRGIHTPRPLAVVDSGRRGLSAVSFLVTEFIQGAENLSVWVDKRREDGMLTEQEKNYILEEVAAILARLHWLGFSQRDLKLSNVLVRTSDRPGGKPEFWLVDTDGIRQRRRVGAARRARDLARLFVALEQAGLLQAAQLGGLLELYLKGSTFTMDELEQLTRRVQKRAERFHH